MPKPEAAVVWGKVVYFIRVADRQPLGAERVRRRQRLALGVHVLGVLALRIAGTGQERPARFEPGAAQLRPQGQIAHQGEASALLADREIQERYCAV